VIDELIVGAFFVNAASMCVEDLRTSSVPLGQALASLLIASVRHMVGEAKAITEWAPLSLGEVLGFLLLCVLIALGKTGSADLVFLLSLRVLLPERMTLNGTSLFLTDTMPVAVTVSEISLANGLLLVLRYKTVSLLRRRGRTSFDYALEFLALFAPLAWAFSAVGEEGEERVPFIPFLVAGAIIGMSLNTLLL
jgi:hypothetical protein